MKKTFLFSLCAALLVLPFFVAASPIIRSGESISVDISQNLEGDFYGLASSINISGPANEDVYVAGGKVTINGAVLKDLSVLGGTVQIHGEVGDDLRVIGGDVVVAAPVGGDVMVFGGTLTVLSTASIEGDLHFFGKKLLLEGDVEGAVHGSAESVRIDAVVGNGIEYTATHSFVLGDKANISGPVVYKGHNEIVRAQGAVIEGDVQHIERTLPDTQNPFQLFLLFFAIVLFSVLALYFVARNVIGMIVTKSQSKFGLYGLIGLGTFLFVPFIAILFLVSVIGSVIGVLLIAGYLTLLIGAYLFGVTTLGFFLQKALLKKTTLTIHTPLIGAVAFSLLALVPIVGTLIMFAVIMVSLGTIMHTLYQVLHERSS